MGGSAVPAGADAYVLGQVRRQGPARPGHGRDIAAPQRGARTRLRDRRALPWHYRVTQGRFPASARARLVGENDEELPWDGKSVGELEVAGTWIAAAHYSRKVRAHRWIDRRALGLLADGAPGGNPSHGLLGEEMAEIVALGVSIRLARRPAPSVPRPFSDMIRSSTSFGGPVRCCLMTRRISIAKSAANLRLPRQGQHAPPPRHTKEELTTRISDASH